MQGGLYSKPEELSGLRSECKAKALTGAAMSGRPFDALLDFAGGTFAAQVQALRHERILRTRGSIDFSDGNRLEWRGREITRLSVTLLDHGGLQDRMLFRSLFGALQGVRLDCSRNYEKASQVKKFNKMLNEFTSEVARLQAAGLSQQRQTLGCASLSMAQLAVLLDGVTSLDRFAKRISGAFTFMSFNPLLEFSIFQSQGVIA